MSLHEHDNQPVLPLDEVSSASPEFYDVADSTDQGEPIETVSFEDTSNITDIEVAKVLRSLRSYGRLGNSRYSTDSTTAFLNEIGRYPLLDGKEEEAELAKAIEAGKMAATKLADESNLSAEEIRSLEYSVELGRLSKERFLVSNVRLVVSIAKYYQRPPSVELNDVIQEGVLGLEHAIELFDYKRGFKFSTYASNWIRQHITRFLALRAQGVKVPDNEYSGLMRAVKEADKENRTLDDLSQKQQKILSLLNLVSLDMQIGDGGTTLVDVLDSEEQGPEAAVVDSSGKEVVHQVMNDVLKPREKACLSMYYGLDGEEPMTLAKIASLTGVSIQTVRSDIKRAKTKLGESKAIQELQ